MKIAYVSNVVYPFVKGGAEKRIYEVGRRLVTRGHDVTVYGRHFWEGPKTTTYDGLKLHAVAPERELYADGRRSIPEAVDFGIRAAHPLWSDLEDYDLVVASVFPYFPVFPTALAARRHDVPLVTTWHEVWRDYWWDYLGRLAPGGIAVEGVTARLPQHPVAVSNVTADRLADIGADRGSISVVPNGVDVDAVQSIKPYDRGFDAVFVGRLVEAKRVDQLLRATAACDGLSLGIVGDGPERARLESLARSLNVADSVTFLGFLEEYDDVLATLRGTDVFVTASEREGFGITALEALAAGCHVVAVDHPNSAVSEVVGGAGVYAAPTADSLAEQLSRVVSGDTTSTDPIKRAQEFDWNVVAAKTEALFEQIVGT